MDMMVLLLIRHAVTDWVGERLAGWTPGIHLSEEGRAQAQALARLLAGVPLAAIYSSPLERTVETAQSLAGSRGLAVEIREGLGETRCGDWTGRALKELQEDELWPIVQTYPGGFRFPGGESMREIQARMVAELDAIREAHAGQIVAAVSHADPIRTAAAYYAGVPLDLFQRLAISPASVTAFAFSRFGPHLACLNYTESLPTIKMDKDGEDKDKEQ